MLAPQICWPHCIFANALRKATSVNFAGLLKTAQMRRWSSFICAILLVLTLWTGGPARAMEPFDCIPVSAQVIGHFDGDEDQRTGNSEKGVAHHHAGCSAHQTAVARGVTLLVLEPSGKLVPSPRNKIGVPGLGPDAQLRPPAA